MNDSPGGGTGMKECVNSEERRLPVPPCLKIALVMIFVASVFSGCATASPNLLFVEMRGIKAQGAIFRKMVKKHEEIDHIQIYPHQLSEGQLHDLWVGLSPDNQTTFSEITEDLIKTNGVPSTKYYSAPSIDTTYYCLGYAFEFRERKLIKVFANRYGYPPKEITAFVKLGSRKSGSSLSLPCSLDDFEKVFGKADKIVRGFGW